MLAKVGGWVLGWMSHRPARNVSIPSRETTIDTLQNYDGLVTEAIAKVVG